MNNVYFGEKGITSTEGNYLANVAKEKIQSLVDKLDNIKLYETKVSVIGSSQQQLLNKGIDNLEWIEDTLNHIAKMNSFCAWIREAIKEKQKQLDDIETYTVTKWARIYEIQLPTQPVLANNNSEVTEEVVINSFDINKRNKYLKLEAYASTFGKYIHPNGTLSRARKAAFNAENNPIYREGSGADTVLYYQNPTISIEEIDINFLNLQNIYRSYEKELNKMKAEIKDTVSKLNIEKEQQRVQFVEDYSIANKKYHEELNKITCQFNKWQISERNRIAQLKIIIPDDLKDIYQKIKE